MKVKLHILLALTLCMPVLVYAQAKNQNRPAGEQVQAKVSKVVIDPGHGGKHPGTVHKQIMEKDITLSIALKLGDLIKRNCPDVQVIYTRTKDVYVDLADRGDIANKAGADLFISIHVNAADNLSASGTSTYIMGTEKSGQNFNVAMRENDVITYEKDYTTKYEGYVPGSAESFVLFSLMQFAYQDQSMMFADIVQKHYKKDLPLQDRGAYHGPFLVLWRTTMPSVLTEVGFMTNDKDRAYITSNKGQTDIAKSMFNAFCEYKGKVEQRANVVEKKPAPSTTQSGSTNQAKTQSGAAAAQSTSPQTQSKPTQQQTTQSQSKPSVGASKGSTQASQPNSAQSTQQLKPSGAVQAADDGGVKFYIQVLSLNRKKDTNSPDFKSYRGKITEKKYSGGYKYLIGSYGSYDEAADALTAVRREFKDAFVIAYEGNKQLSLDDARKRTSK